MLQPAEIFLDRSGEEIRRRTFTLTDPSGRDLALRPDLTIPICRDAVRSDRKWPARICYNGLVFRHQPGEPNRPTQFFQAGAELLGLEDRAAGETEILSLTIDALRVSGLKDFSLRIGDLALFNALVDALALPRQWRQRLFGRPGDIEQLGDGVRNDGIKPQGRGFRGTVQRPRYDLRPATPGGGRVALTVQQCFDLGAGARQFGRTVAMAQPIKQALDITRAPEMPLQALAEVRALLKATGIALDPQLAAMDARLATLKSLGIAPEKVQFTAHFGRNMEYYTGFVFELWARDREGQVQVAGGGRYDTLLESLGAKQAVSAIGCAIRTERLLAAKAVA